MLLPLKRRSRPATTLVDSVSPSISRTFSLCILEKSPPNLFHVLPPSRYVHPWPRVTMNLLPLHFAAILTEWKVGMKNPAAFHPISPPTCHCCRAPASLPPSCSPSCFLKLDLRDARQCSLEYSPYGYLVLKSFDISPSRPHLVLFGGSDQFARLFNKRKLSLGACCDQMPPLDYFRPNHLFDWVSFSIC